MSDPAPGGGDREMVARTLAGDQAAFADIVRLHKHALHTAIARIIGDEDEALDLVQESFVAAHGALRRYDPARPMRGWLLRIAVNKARDWRRRRFVRRLFTGSVPTGFAEQTPDDTPATDVALADRQELARVDRAIAALAPPLREVLVLRTIEGLSQSETAEALGISVKAVETRLHRARRTLAEKVA